MFLNFEVFGKAAHSGGNFEKGISAIGELAHKIVAMHALTDLTRGVTVNVGPSRAASPSTPRRRTPRARSTCATSSRRIARSALAALQEIVDRATVPGTTAKLEISGEFLPLTATPASEELFATYQAAAADAGLVIAGEFTGGCADSGFTAAVGCPTLCATGPVGANAHTPEEYMEVASLVPRAQALALAILRLPAAA